jgi:hypothetical protein
MIRKAAIVVLTVATLATLYAGYVGFGSPSKWGRFASWPEFPYEASGKYCTWTCSDKSAEVLVRTGGGKLGVVWKRYEEAVSYQTCVQSGWSWNLPLIRCERLWDTLLSGTPSASWAWPGEVLSVLVSVWLPVIALATYPVIVFIRGPLRRRRRRRRGLCRNCGYNLRGLTEARCPECGKAFDPELLAALTTPDVTHATRGGE